MAVGHTILRIAYHLLNQPEVYRDLGAHYFDDRERHAVQQRLVHRLEGLGDRVAIQPATPPAPAA